jgi:predicted CxxxxCH...CXXCH cytochrome family protein
MKKNAILLFFITMLTAGRTGYALDAPHDATNNITCSTRCHLFAVASQPWMTLPTGTPTIDDTFANHLCKDCHTLGGAAPDDVVTHSSYQTSTQYGTWEIECRTCHDPHYQMQVATYPTSSLNIILTGTTVSISPNADTVAVSVTTMTPDAFKRYIFIPNINYPDNYYRIISNGTNTIRLSEPLGSPSYNPIDTTMVFPGDVFIIRYSNLVKSTIITPSGASRSVRFFNNTGPNSFAGSTAAVVGVCQVCHTKTLYFRGDGSVLDQGGHPEPAGVNCTQSCHLHSTGFKANCSMCHGNPPINNTKGGPTNGLVLVAYSGEAYSTGSSTAGAHNLHVNSKAIDCAVCHYGSKGSGTLHNDGTLRIKIGFSGLGGKVATGYYRGQTTANYLASYSGTTVNNAGDKTCGNLYCHSNAKLGTSVYISVTPVWDGAGPLACNACHGTTNSLGYPDYVNGGAGTVGLATANSHPGHVATMGYMCQTCHLQTTTTGTSIRPDIVPSLHVNGNTQNVAFDTIAQPLGSYNTGAKQCSNISCHASINPIWGQILGCDGCHGFPPATGAHMAHIESAGLLGITGYGTPVAAWYGDASNATNYALGCGNCHPGSNASHMTGTAALVVNLYEAGAPGGSLKSRNAASAAYGNLWSGAGKCSAVYCHSSGNNTATSVVTAVSPSWNDHEDAYAATNGLAGRCGICHGNPPQYASAGTGTVGSNSHYNATAFMGKEGGHGVTAHFDNVYNRVTGVGLLSQNATTESSHGNNGSSTTMLCYACHAATASSITPDTYSMNTSTVFRCTGCHSATSGAIADKAKHVNGQADVAFASINFKSKAQLRNVPTTQWTRMNNYGTAGAHDQTTSELNSGSYNTTTKTCTTDCHLGNAATWGDTTITCDSCHTSLP